MKIKFWEYLVLFMVSLGGVNWGFAVLFNFNIVEEIISVRLIQDAVYFLTMIAGLYSVYLFRKMLKGK